MTTSKELIFMLLFVNWVVIDTGILASIPLEDKFTIIQTPDTLLSPNDAQVAFLQLEVQERIRGQLEA